MTKQYKVKCDLCGRTKKSEYKHDVCECGGSMHNKPMKSLLQALEENDKRTEKRLMKQAERGEIIRLI